MRTQADPRGNGALEEMGHIHDRIYTLRHSYIIGLIVFLGLILKTGILQTGPNQFIENQFVESSL